jgi:hypothetical protein
MQNSRILLELERIPELIQNVISGPTIVYWGIGAEFKPKEINSLISFGDEENKMEIENTTESNTNNDSGWKPELNQQFPLFLQNFVVRNPDVRILIILIDQVQSRKPYIVRENDKFYSGNWTNNKYANLYESVEYPISVATFRQTIGWDTTKFQYGHYVFNIKDIFELSAQVVLANNALMFYHEYTGLDTSRIEKFINPELKMCFHNKICIDISCGSEGECFPKFDDPHMYPIIRMGTYRNLEWVNPRTLDSSEKTRLLNVSKSNEDNNEIDNKIRLFEEVPTDYILISQLKKINLSIFIELSNTLFVILRQLDSTNRKVPDFEWILNQMSRLTLINPDIKNFHEEIVSLVGSSTDSTNNIRIKEQIKINCYNILSYFVNTIINEYALDTSIINHLIEEIDSKSPYQKVNEFKRFLTEISLI